MASVTPPDHHPPTGATLRVGWTGHRDLEEVITRQAAAEVVKRLKQTHTAIVGVGSVAVGSDLAIAEAFHESNAPLWLLLPETRSDFEPNAIPENAARIDTLLDVAADVQVTRPTTTDERYMETGVAIVESADLLIAVWDGDAAGGLGGTADVVNYATSLGLPIIRIHPATGHIDWSDFPVPSSEAVTLHSEGDVQKLLETLDASARQRAWPARTLLLRIIFLHLLATAVAVLALVFDKLIPTHYDTKAAAVVKVGALAWSLVLVGWHRHQHHAWLSSRVAAELCRSILALWSIRRDATTPVPPQHPSLRSLFYELAGAWRTHSAEAKSTVADASGHYVANRLDPQIDYFRRHFATSRRLTHVAHRFAFGSTWLAIALGLTAILLPMLHIEGVFYGLAKSLSIVLPLVSAALLLGGTASDVTRRSARYGELVTELERLRLRIAGARTWKSLGRQVASTERLLLDELGEWHTFNRFAGEAH